MRTTFTFIIINPYYLIGLLEAINTIVNQPHASKNWKGKKFLEVCSHFNSVFRICGNPSPQIPGFSCSWPEGDSSAAAVAKLTVGWQTIRVSVPAAKNCL